MQIKSKRVSVKKSYPDPADRAGRLAWFKKSVVLLFQGEQKREEGSVCEL